MPTFIAVALIAGFAAGAAATIVTGVAFAFAWGAFAASLVLGGLAKVLAKDPRSPGLSSGFDARGRNVTIRQPLAPWRVVVGEARVGGVLTYCVESSNGNMHAVVTLSCHTVEAIGDVYFDDEIIPIAAPSGSPLESDGSATGRFAGAARIQKNLGPNSSAQPFTDLVYDTSGDWSTAHIQQERAKIYVRMANSPSLYPTGIPNFTAIVKGLKAYDPRTAGTAWTHNPALLVSAYLTNTAFGLGATYATEIDEDTLTAAANVCEERVLLAGETATVTADASLDTLTVAAGARLPNTGDGIRLSATGSPAGAFPSPLVAATTYYWIRDTDRSGKLATSYANAIAGTAINITSAPGDVLTMTYYDEPRYTANGSFHADEEPKSILEKLLASMAGKVVNAGGKWYIFAGAYEAPTVTLDEDDLAGPIRVQPILSRRDSCNGVKGAFVDPSNAWTPGDFPAVASDTYMAEDNGERVWRDIDLTGFTISPSMAQRLAKIELLRIRQGLTVEANFKLTAFQAMTGRTVAITNTKFGWSGKAFDVVGSSFIVAQDGTLGVKLQLRETAAAIFDWETSEEQTVDLAPNTSLPDPWTATPPTGLTWLQILTTQGRGTLSCTAPTDSFHQLFQFEYQYNTGSPTGAWIALPRTTQNQIQLEGLTAGSYNFRVLSVNTLGVESEYATTTGVVVTVTMTDQNVTMRNFALATEAGGNRVIWGLSEIATYPDVLPAQLSLAFSGQAQGGGSNETVNFYWVAMLYTSKPTSTGTARISASTVGSPVNDYYYTITGSGTDFTLLQAGDWFIFTGSTFQHLFEVISVTNATSMRVKHVYQPSSPLGLTNSLTAFSTYRGTVTEPTPTGNNRTILASSRSDVALLGEDTLPDAGYIGIISVVLADMAGSTAVSGYQCQLKSQWIATLP